MKSMNLWLALLGLVVVASAGYLVMNKKEAAPGAGAQSGLMVLNVLDKQEYEDCHIKGSINVPLDALETFAANLDKESAEIVVYCSNYMCTGSAFAAKKLKEMGFKKVWAYEGGMAEWHQLGLPVEGPCTSSYLARKIPAPEHTPEGVITAQELAQKMNVAA